MFSKAGDVQHCSTPFENKFKLDNLTPKLRAILVPSQLLEFALRVPTLVYHQLVGLLAFDDDQELTEEILLPYVIWIESY